MSQIDPEQTFDAPAGADNAATAQSGGRSELEHEIAELKDRNLRLVAELQNVQRRAQREKEESLRFAESEFAKQLLVVLDGLERAQESARDARNVAAVAEGVRLVHDQFVKILRDHHIEAIDAEGARFDPAMHEAMMQQPAANVPPGHVVQQLARGYRMHGRVLRPAKVVVSKES